MALYLYSNGFDYIIAKNPQEAQEILMSYFPNMDWIYNWEMIPPQNKLILIQNNKQIRQRVCKWIKECGKGLLARKIETDYKMPDWWKERQEEKQKSRVQDELDLKSGKKTVEQLNKENARFAFPNAVVLKYK